MLKDKSLGWWFVKLLLNRGNWIIMLGAIVVTIGFLSGAVKHNEVALGVIGVLIFLGYIYTRIVATLSYKKIIDDLLEKGMDDETAINLADKKVNEQ